MSFLVLALASALLGAAGIVLLLPLMRRYALARPNARSSHREPTPQGGGIAVVGATLLTAGLALAWSGGAGGTFAIVAAATISLAGLGALDDIRPLPVGPRLAAQAIAVATVVIVAARESRVAEGLLPFWPEVAIATFAGLWFVNLTNFMDGLDWITVAIVLPIATAVAAFGAAGIVEPVPTVVAVALAGALVGFAPFNKPVARLFLGDVGSLPIGLLVAWLLYALASQGHFVTAVLLALYPCLDATATLIRRFVKGERVWEAHRTHFYQRATDRGLDALGVSTRVFATQCGCALLAGLCVAVPTLPVVAGAGLAGLALVLFLMRDLVRPRAPREART